jgi:hypothetical protein
MSRVRFRAGSIDLELTGSEPFVLRQMKLFSEYLGGVDAGALAEAPPREVAVAPAQVAEPAPAAAAPAAEPAPVPEERPAEAARGTAAPPTNGGHTAAPARATNGGAETPDDLIRFYGRFQPQGLDRQSDAALLFAYYLQQREGLPSLQLGDLIRCCIRAGVDTRNFNRTLGILTRRGYLETVRHGHAYRLSEHGVAAVESRM